MKIKVITASAGSGKTTRLSEVLDEAIASKTARPEGIIATTFTRHAAAELIERARGKLLANGRGREAHQLLAARIGTVNSVCGALVTDFAFELGLSPDLRVLDETAAELEQQRALATIVDSDTSRELHGFRDRFDRELDWRSEVRQLIAAARSNGLRADDLRTCAARSSASLDACLGPVAPNAAILDDALSAAIDRALAELATLGELKKGTIKYRELLEEAQSSFERNRLRWGDWAKLSAEPAIKQAHGPAAPVMAAAAQHRAHPRLREEMHRLIHLLFHVAADGLAAYQAHKHALGAIDFIDQEALCLTLLRRPDVRDALAGQIDLVLIDEFQDTSPLQLAIFLELAALARESVWVGDQKQAIFGFRGTDPALMDAMIESLTSPVTDAELVSKTVAAVGATGELETLDTSYRSRKDLVHLTSDLFARAFVHHGIPEDRTRLAPVDKPEPTGLGPIVEHWPLQCPDRVNKEKLANCTATGVRSLLDTKPLIRDRRTNLARPATAGDVAVLCRTNEQCDQLAEALSLLGIPAVLPRVGLFSTAEGQLLLAALALWIDPRDSLAAANLARLVTYATDLDALVQRSLTTPGSDAFADDPLVRAVLDTRTLATDLDPVATITTLIDATHLRDLAASWGRATQRLANLDALRAHAAAYVAHATARREAPTLVGLLAYFESMTEEWGWKVTRSDDQALLDSGNAVTVSTWHAAKGREWPLVILYGLEALREPRAFGLHVETDAQRFELTAPLAGRWLRYWPNPYTTPNQNGAVKDAFAASTQFSTVVERHEREALRLLYVGWTRARDRLILAAADGKLLDGLLGILVKLDASLLSIPTGTPVTWAGRDVDVPVRPCAPSAPLAPPVEAGTVTVGRPSAAFPPARQSPSTAEPVACTIGTPITLGPRLSLRGSPEMGALGDAVHAFLAADRPEHPQPERIARASRLLDAHGVAGHLDPAEVAEAGTRLWTWLASLPTTRLHREWPVTESLAMGTVVNGTADLVGLTDTGYVVVDHKTFPGTLDVAVARLPRYSGQLATYARGIQAATGTPVVSTWVHLPVLGVVVPIYADPLPTERVPEPPPETPAPTPRARAVEMTVNKSVPGELAEGVYEHLVTEQLDRLLGTNDARKRVVEEVDDADAHIVLARHLGREIEKALNSLPSEKRAEQARALSTKLLDFLADQLKGDAADLLRDQRPAAPTRQLLAIHRGGTPPRPTTPLATSTLLSSRRDPSFGHELSREAASADRIDAIIAFVTVGGVRTIIDSLQQFSRRPNAQLRLITTTFTGTTQVAALDTLARLPGAQVKVSYDTRRTRLHAKAWHFHRATGLSTAYVGSANLTATALGAGHEWMVKISNADLGHIIDKFGGTFETLWEDPEFELYDPDNQDHRQRLAAALSAETAPADDRDRFLVRLQPLPFQQEILDKLDVERTIHQRTRNLVIAATGTGKTVIAALDYARNAQRRGVPPRLLFLAHRAELLEQARRTFRYALQDASFGELLVGGEEPQRWEHVFASIQSAASTKLLERFGPSYFQHVVVDECHHVPARSYQALVPNLTPEILVGLTATPERTDNQSLLPDFGGHISAELRLWHALDDQLLVPFEYYGISDGTDLRDVRWTRTGYDAASLAELYTGNDRRADLVRHQLAIRVADPRAIRALGFCVSVEHAKFMAARFTAAGIPSLAVHADSIDRDRAPQLLRERSVNVLFTCDLYNEGVDLPFVDTLLLLRPTQSATLFLQQLGRGLRLHPDKSTCLILDFIGQHRDEFRFDQTLPAFTGVPRPALKKAIEDGFPFLPSGCSLQLDHVARTQILSSLRASLGGAKRLAGELRELAATGTPPSLATFLDSTGRELDDVYEAGGWTTLKRLAGIIPTTPDADEVDDLSRRLGMLQHIDEPARLRSYRDLLRSAASHSLNDFERRRMIMLESQLHHRGTLRAAEAAATYIASKPSILEELDELREVLEDRVTLPAQIHPVPEWPLALHRHYSRREIAAGVGYVTAGDKSLNLQTGILKLPETKQELLFVTLDKSGKDFSPTTRYRDYAISADRFHWETQAGASVTRPSGRRYIDSASNGWRFYLFVRTDPDAVFCFLGPVRYASHEGDRPIAITWQLETPMPSSVFERYATLRSA